MKLGSQILSGPGLCEVKDKNLGSWPTFVIVIILFLFAPSRWSRARAYLIWNVICIYYRVWFEAQYQCGASLEGLKGRRLWFAFCPQNRKLARREGHRTR